MAILFNQDKNFKERVDIAVHNEFKQNAIRTAQNVFYSKRKELVDQVDEWQDFRQEAADLRDHVLANLDYYLNQFAENAEKNGCKVYFAQTDKEASAQVLEIFKAKQAKMLVKSKSMMTEEIDLNHVLLEAGIEVNETDLAESILQTADWDPPSHIVVPALHFERKAIRKIFNEKLGYEGTEDPEEMTRFVRKRMRERFLKADIGVTGCNFAVAETGTMTLVSNEGNGRMSTSIPNTQVVILGMERIVPSFEALDVMMELLIRSSVGAKISNYFSMVTGPRKADEVDGPEEIHIVIVDNGRSKIIAGQFREMLRCIRCGACMNICPVYRHITGHAYGSIYPGPMGAVLTPLLVGYEKAGALPYASTLCGACTDHCPVIIPIHELLLLHRQKLVEEFHYPGFMEKSIFKVAGIGLGSSGMFDLGTKMGAFGMGIMGGKKGRLGEGTKGIPVLGGWTKSRDMELLKKEKVRDWFEKREKGGRK